jgi:hypothetical protein
MRCRVEVKSEPRRIRLHARGTFPLAFPGLAFLNRFDSARVLSTPAFAARCSNQ